ncbi:patatin-like phospholipase family protein [Mesorhizobium erdmanii]|uniref:patatin-like phospholipase family protein n=1 Tax=Mesorhizobium erdmanii TaxID=1777866 RepID=UPI00041E2691|nr:patatin-like phospholipase family protein [Mesorhizobium erdmanii]
MPSGTDNKTALVLAGGGSFGAVQVGMLKALVAAGMTADFVVGSSVGAINGAYYAAAGTVETIARLETLWRGITRNDVFPMSWRSMLGFAARRDFLSASHGIRTLIERNLPYRNLEDAPIPIHIIATDLFSGEAVVLSHGNAADAIAASSAIPVAFAPVKVGDRLLIDAAVTSNTPIGVAIGLGAHRLIVLPTGFACNLQAPPQGAVANGLHALTLLIARQLVRELDTMPAGIDYAIVPSLCPLMGSPYDFTRTGALIDDAEESTRAWIEAGGLFQRVIPNQMRPHSHH